MAKNYAEEESLERIYRRLKGQSDPDPVESTDESLAGIAEILQGSSTENLNFFVPLYMRPQTSAPTGSALDYLGGVLYAEDGSLKWYGSSGTITTLAGS
ncbi:MAG: hypothetical protein ACXABD_18310 [Candidatus Thorarchaeota archaeon]|jgi:hypothetical protein